MPIVVLTVAALALAAAIVLAVALSLGLRALDAALAAEQAPLDLFP